MADPSLAGLRLDVALARLAPQHSRSRLQSWVRDGLVRVDGAVCEDVRRKLAGGESIQVQPQPSLEERARQAEEIPLAVAFEDAHLLVVDKPPGLVVHPGSGNWSGTLMNALLHHVPQAAGLPRAGIVHRLDKDTSGLMLVARTRAAMDRLVAMIAAREVSRQYMALAHRPWQGAPERRLEAPIGRDPRNRLRMAVVDPQRHPGKAAATVFRLMQQGAAGCAVRCTLETGRTHQIRVHLAHIGHPLVADPLYGGAPAAGLQRQALHAFRLALAHPVTAAPLCLHAPLPADLRAAWAAWGLRYNESDWLSGQPAAAA